MPTPLELSQGAAGERPSGGRTAVPVVLVNMPLSAIERPSLALGLLKSLLDGAGLRSKVVYSNMWFAEYVGIGDYHLLESALPEEGLVDWLFGGVAFPDFQPDHDLFLTEYFVRNPHHGSKAGELKAALKRSRESMIEFVAG